MSAVSYPLVNGMAYDWSSLDIKLAGVSNFGIKSLDFSDSLEPGKVYGAGSQIRAYTRGVYAAEASLEMYRAEANNFEAFLVSQNANTGLYEISFDITVTYQADNNQPVITDLVRGARITKAENSQATASSDPLSRKYTLVALYVIKNGVNPLTNMLL